LETDGLSVAAEELSAYPAAQTSTSERDPNKPETWGRVSRNEACPCGSGKKYKHCHGVLA